MTIGSSNGLGAQIRYYSDLSNLDLLSGQARAAQAPGGSRNFLFGGRMIDNKNRDDGTQTWGAKWLDSYRTVLVQRAQTLQRKLNNIYTKQLGGNLYKSIADNANYSMANLQRQDSRDVQLDPTAVQDGGAIWAMIQDMNGKSRDAQKPVSYEYGKPDPGFFDFTGKLWDPLEREDWGSWMSRQYNKPAADLRMPWEHIGDYFEVWNPFGGGPMPRPPKAIPLIPPVVFFKMFDFVGDMLMPLFYPMIFTRYETFAHSDADSNAIDASVIRSDYNFTAPSISQFPVIGQIIGGVLTGLTPVFAAIPDANGNFLSTDDIKAALDMLTNKQSNAMAPRMVETETGGFFAATQALQDWDLDNMEYQYYSATNYQEDFVDTDFLAAFRKAGAKLFKILVNAILTATGIGNILKIPPLSFIADMLLEFISTMLMDGLLGPIRKFVEVDTQYDRTNNGLVDADATSTLHVGDPGGLFGLDTAWEPGGYALAYRDDDAYNVQALNSVTVYTNRKKIGDLWDGRGILDETEWKGTTFQSTGSRIHNVGYATNPPLNLATFRFNTQDRYSNGDTGKMDFDSSTGPNEKPHGSAGTYDRQDDYWMTAATKLGDQIKTGSRKLNPSFGGGIRLTDLDTNLDDTFFYGSGAFLPDNGNANVLTLSGTDFVAANNGIDEDGVPITVPAPPVTNNVDGYSYAKMGKVTFDATSPTTDTYVFGASDDGGNAITGLKVVYNGPDTLTGPGNALPVNVAEARKQENYRVTNANGVPITADVVVSHDPLFIDHGAVPPGTVDPLDWVMANSMLDAKFNAADPTAADDKTSDWNKLDLGLNTRVEPLLPTVILPNHDRDDTPGKNFTSVQLVSPAITDAELTARLGPAGTPNSGAAWTQVNTASLSDLTTVPWTNWDFATSSTDNDYNRDGSISAGPVNAGYGNSIEAASAQKEAWIAWNRLIDQQVPASFYRKENTSTNPATDEWNMKYSPWDPNTGSSGTYDTTTHSPGAGPQPATAVNPYFWTDGAGNQYIQIWDNPGNAARDGATGKPIPPAQPIAVYKYSQSGNGATSIQVITSNTLPAGAARPVLMHNETQIVTIDDDSSLGLPASKMLRILDDLRKRGYSQGRSTDDTAGAYYTTAGSVAPSPIPPVGTPGDFMIMNHDPGRNITLAFTRPYDGVNDVPPSQFPNGDPREDWDAVNGWYLTYTTDAGLGARTYAPGGRKLMLDRDVQGSNVWAMQDFMHPTGLPATPTVPFPGWYTGLSGGTHNVPMNGYIYTAVDMPTPEAVSLGTKFTIDNISGNPADHRIYVAADDAAAVFVNGIYVGTSYGYGSPTELVVPPSVLRPGENIITTQVMDRGGPGGVNLTAVINGAVVRDTSAAQALQWQVLKSPIVGTADEIKVEKKVTLGANVLPGEFVDIGWSGVNSTPYQAGNIGPDRSYDYGVPPAVISYTRNDMTALIPDRAIMTVTNVKGSFKIPLTEFNETTKQWEQRDDGSGIFHIPSDYLASGQNTFEVNVERGGIVQQFCMDEPPAAPPSGWLYRNLAEPQVQAAGYWVNSTDITDDMGLVAIPAGSLLYGGQLVDPLLQPPLVQYNVKDGIIHRNIAGLITSPCRPGEFTWRPDSYFDRTSNRINNAPIFNAMVGGSQYTGYMLKKDIREGMAMGNKDDNELLHTYTLKTFDRYAYDPNTQSIMDIMQATTDGLEGINGAKAGSEVQDVPYVGSTDQVNTKPPLTLAPNGVQIVGAPPGAEMTRGMTMLGKAPVGTKIGKNDRQTYGSDDNELTRTLYAAMKPIDIDGMNEDLNGNGVLDAGEDSNGDGILQAGTQEADARAYKEYRDCFNYGLLDHIYISGSAYSPTGGGFSSTMEYNWKGTDVKDRTTDHLSRMGTEIQSTSTKTLANSYMNNYEYFANETDRRNKKYTVVRRGDMLMNSFYSFRKEQ
jgi:hypothetical protein